MMNTEKFSKILSSPRGKRSNRKEHVVASSTTITNDNDNVYINDKYTLADHRTNFENDNTSYYKQLSLLYNDGDCSPTSTSTDISHIGRQVYPIESLLTDKEKRNGYEITIHSIIIKNNSMQRTCHIYKEGSTKVQRVSVDKVCLLRKSESLKGYKARVKNCPTEDDRFSFIVTIYDLDGGFVRSYMIDHKSSSNCITNDITLFTISNLSVSEDCMVNM